MDLGLNFGATEKLYDLGQTSLVSVPCKGQVMSTLQQGKCITQCLTSSRHFINAVCTIITTVTAASVNICDKTDLDWGYVEFFGENSGWDPEGWSFSFCQDRAVGSPQAFRKGKGDVQGRTPCWFFFCLFGLLPHFHTGVCCSRAPFHLPLSLFCSGFLLSTLPTSLFSSSPKRQMSRELHTLPSVGSRFAFLKLKHCFLIPVLEVYLDLCLPFHSLPYFKILSPPIHALW